VETEDISIIEAALGNLGRLRILRVLAANGFLSYTRYGLEKATKLKPVAVRRYLRILVELGLVEEINSTPVTYRINYEEAFTASLIEFFRKVEYLP
jgi:DNA-binding transcriptional ArsR family regulator